MAARASWKGYLKLSLVSCAVEMYPATTQKERVAFHLLNRETGNRLRRQLVDPDTQEVVDSQDQVKGYEVSKREYVVLEEEEIEQVALESTHTIDIESFVPRAQIDENYIDTPYFLAPDGKVAEEAFAVIREAMKERDVVGLGRVVLYRRERIVMLEPRGKGLVARTLRYAYEVRSEDEVFDDIGDVKIEPEMLKLAAHIIDTKLSDFDPKQFEDRYQNALLEIIRAKAGHKPIKRAPEAPPPSNVVSLMDALRKSVAAESGGTKPAARRNPSPARGKSATTGRKGSGRAKTGARRAS